MLPALTSLPTSSESENENLHRSVVASDCFYFSVVTSGSFSLWRESKTAYSETEDSDLDEEEPDGTEKLRAMCGDFDPMFQQYMPHQPRWAKLASEIDHIENNRELPFRCYSEPYCECQSAIPPSDERFDLRLLKSCCYNTRCFTEKCGLENETCPDTKLREVSPKEKEEQRQIKELMIRMHALKLDENCCKYCHKDLVNCAYDRTFCCCLKEQAGIDKYCKLCSYHMDEGC